MKILKKTMAAIVCFFALLMLSSCSGEYTMTAEDLAIQKSIVGFWAASNTTDYNTYDENGDLTMLTVVEFTDDFKYYLYNCYINGGYVMTYAPTSYTFEKGKFRVDVDGVPSYAAVSVSEDGNSMYWITDAQTDRYEKLDKIGAIALGIQEHTEESETSLSSESEISDTETGSEE